MCTDALLIHTSDWPMYTLALLALRISRHQVSFRRRWVIKICVNFQLIMATIDTNYVWSVLIDYQFCLLFILRLGYFAAAISLETANLQDLCCFTLRFIDLNHNLCSEEKIAMCTQSSHMSNLIDLNNLVKGKVVGRLASVVCKSVSCLKKLQSICRGH